MFFRYDRVNVVDVAPFDLSGSFANSVPALNIGVGWTHVFNSSLLLENRIGRAQRPFSAIRSIRLASHRCWRWDLLVRVEPKSVSQPPLGAGFSLQTPGFRTANTIESPVTSFSNGLTWTHGGHQFKFGFEYIKQGNDSDSPPYGGYDFADATTGDPRAGRHNGLIPGISVARTSFTAE